MTDPSLPSVDFPGEPRDDLPGDVLTHARHAAPASATAQQRKRWLKGGAVLGVIVLIVVVIILLVSGGKSPNNAALKGPASGLIKVNQTALANISTYQSASSACKAKADPTICIEAANRKLGDEIHIYANYMGAVSQFGPKGKLVGVAVETAQITANDFEILGDAAPTAANYKKVLHHFDVPGQINKLQTAINNVKSAFGG